MDGNALAAFVGFLILILLFFIPIFIMALEDRHKRLLKEREKIREEGMKSENQKRLFILEMAERGYSQDTLGNWVKIQ